MPAPTSSSRIDIWRHEVSSSVSASGSEYSSLHSVPQTSFWKKLIKPKAGSGGEGRGKATDEVAKTGMYDDGDEERAKDEKVKEKGHVGSSMDLGSGESELGGFRERRERLERAARLLNEVGKKGEEKEGR